MAHPWETDWQLGDQIGKGGQGLTYVATNRSTGKQGVLKKLKDNRSPVSRARMHREAANMQVLNTTDANVPELLEHNTELHSDGKTELFLVSEFIPGTTLDLHVNKSVLSIDTAIGLIQSVANTLSIAHAEKILHRDLKPDNVILRDNDTSDIVLIDFGLSFNESNEDLTETEETFRNKFLDLPETNTPTGDRRDFRSDITCLSALLYFCLTGHRLGQLSDSNGVLPHRRKGFALRDYLPNDPRVLGLESLLDTGLQPSLNSRFQTIDEFLTRLKIATALSTEQTGNISDLAQLAYRNLHATDRNSQLHAIHEQIQTPSNNGFKKINSLKKDLTPLGLEGANAQLQKTPDGFDKLDGKFHFWKLTSPPKTTLCVICITIVADGPNCVLLGQKIVDENALPQLMTTTTGWHEISRFLPTNPDIEQIVFESIERIIRRVLVEIASQ